MVMLNSPDDNPTLDRQAHLPKGLVHAASGVVFLAGVLVLCGWVFHVPVMTSVLPGLVTMKANTAVGFVLAGMALFALVTERLGTAQKPTVRVLAGAVALLGLLTLCQFVFGWNLGLDQLLFQEPPGSVFTSQPGRMAPTTAFDFLALGIALLVIDMRRGRMLAQLLALVAGLLASLALVGYLFDEHPLYAVGSSTTIAVHTAALFVVLSVGVLLARVKDGLMTQAARRFSSVGFGAALLILLLIALGAYRNLVGLAEINRRVTHTHQVIEQLASVLTTMQDVETGERGFVITGDERFLEPCKRAESNVAGGLSELRQLTADNPRQQARLDRLGPLIARKIQDANAYVNLRREQGITPAIQAVTEGEGRQTMDDIRALMVEITGEENELLRQRQAVADARAANAILALLMGAGAAIGLLVAVFYALRVEIGEHQRTETALRRAEEATERERARLQFIFDAVPVGISLNLFRPDGRRPVGRETHLVNDAHLRICGLTREQVGEEGIFRKITDPEDRQRQARLDEEVLAGKSDHYSLDKRYLRSDGQLVWVLFSFERRRYADGSCDDLVVVVDITRRKQMEEALRRSEEKLAVTLQSIGDAVLATDASGNVTRLNPVAEQLIGWTQAEAQGRPISEVFRIFNETTRQPAIVPVERVLATGIIHGLANHTVVVARDGTEHPIADSAAPMRDKNGQVIGVVLVFRDVTQERRAEQLLQESEHQLRVLNAELERRVEERAAALQESERLGRAALDALTAHVAILDEQGTIIATNQAWREFAAQGASSLVQAGPGANYLAVCVPATGQLLESAPKIVQGIRLVIAGQQKEFALEYECHLPKEKRWFHCRITRFPGAGAVRVVMAHENVTHMKLLERQQFRAQRMESLGTLAGGVAHDLNNALAPILLSTELIRTEYPNATEMIDLIAASAKRGADMVRQLLTFARGAEGTRISLQPRHLIREMESIIKGTFPKNIGLEIKYERTLPTVLGDATQLHQVLLNLCVNARDAMPNGGTLTVEAQPVNVDATFASSAPEAKLGRHLLLQVRDTGTGIPPEIMDRIFDPFFTTKTPDKGTGLGLSTVLGIVKSHGGFLKVYSHPGQGSTFSVYLPAEGAGSDTEHLVRTTGEFRGQGEAILFVDDEAAVREAVRAVLKKLDFRPLTATDGSDGLIEAIGHRQELRAVIADLHMPHMDGLAFIRALRRMLPDIPVVMASGRLEDRVKDELATLGVKVFLDKPFTEGQLVEALKKLLLP
jgi:PAS domain S-box-containing protein